MALRQRWLCTAARESQALRIWTLASCISPVTGKLSVRPTHRPWSRQGDARRGAILPGQPSSPAIHVHVAVREARTALRQMIEVRRTRDGVAVTDAEAP